MRTRPARAFRWRLWWSEVGSMSKKAKVVILCEGIKDYNFARRALQTLGWRRRRFTPQYTSLSGGGAGEQFVRDQYPAEVRLQRDRQGVVLVVCVDADKKSVVQRAAQLAKALKDDRQAPRRLNEQIAHWIPRRHLETWVHLYAKSAVDEETDYKHAVSDDDHVQAAARWGQDLRRKSIGNRRCPSLDIALRETRRIR